MPVIEEAHAFITTHTNGYPVVPVPPVEQSVPADGYHSVTGEASPAALDITAEREGWTDDLLLEAFWKFDPKTGQWARRDHDLSASRGTGLNYEPRGSAVHERPLDRKVANLRDKALKVDGLHYRIFDQQVERAHPWDIVRYVGAITRFWVSHNRYQAGQRILKGIDWLIFRETAEETVAKRIAGKQQTEPESSAV